MKNRIAPSGIVLAVASASVMAYIKERVTA